MRTPIALILALAVLPSIGCDDGGDGTGADSGPKQYEVALVDLSDEFSASTSLETLRQEEREAIEAVLRRTPKEDREDLRRGLEPGHLVSIVAMSDSIAADLVSRLYSIRALRRERERRARP